jgi:hypothetical protein
VDPNRSLSALLLGLASAALVACVSEQRPPPEGDTVASELASEEQDDDVSGSPSDGADVDAARPEACPPSTFRECRHYYRDARGQLNCPLSYQFCRADGKGWLPCGKYVTGEDGSPQPPL